MNFNNTFNDKSSRHNIIVQIIKVPTVNEHQELKKLTLNYRVKNLWNQIAFG